MIENRNFIDLTTGSGGGGGTSDYTDLENKPQINSTTLSGNQSSSDLGLQEALVSGTNIKTINSTSLLGEGDVTVQETLVSGTNIKTINNTSLLGSGDITIGGGDYTAGTGLLLTDSEFDILQEDYPIPVPGDAIQVEGSLTIDGYVYSGFSYSNSQKNYAYAPNFSWNPATEDIEIQIKVMRTMDTSNRGWLWSVDTSGAYFDIHNSSWGYVCFPYGTTSGNFYVEGTGYDTINQWRWVKFTQAGSNATLAWSADGTNWTTETKTLSSSGSAFTGKTLFFGSQIGNSSSNDYFKGKIDFDETYVKINGEYVFRPSGGYNYKPVAKATSSLYGLVKPDNSTIIATNGVISLPTTGYDATKTQTLKNVSGVIQWVDD